MNQIIYTVVVIMLWSHNVFGIQVGVSIAVAIGLRFQEAIYADASADVRAILHSGLVPGALTSIILNLVLPGRPR